MSRTALLEAIKNLVTNASSRVDPKRYAQESAYVDAFIGRLDGIISLESGGEAIEIKATIVSDRGRGSAESKFGADFCLVFESSNSQNKIKKAVISQAKKGNVDSLSRNEITRLESQCKKMARITNNYFILETPSLAGAIPTIRIGNSADCRWNNDRIPFDVYLVDHIISCRHGDKRDEFIESVMDSNLTKMVVKANDLSLKPDAPSNNAE